MKVKKKNTYPSPCDKCTYKLNCTRYRGCSAWKTRYLYRQKQINAYAEKVLPAFYAQQKEGEV